MDQKTKRWSLGLAAVLCLGLVCVFALYRPGRPTPAHTRGRAAHDSTLTSATPRAAEEPPPTWDPLAEDKSLWTPTAQTGEVKLSAKVDRSSVLVRSDGQVQVQLILTAPSARGDVARRASDVLVVLDVSGSMSGQKLDYAKRALHQLVSRLGSEDRFALVTYASGSELVVPLSAATSSAQRHWHRLVDGLATAGGTNMSAGLDLGLAQLMSRHDRAARVLLLSDGHANEGDSSVPGLQARARRIVRAEHVLTTMGIGDDFNEDLMTSLAEVGTGNFYYLSRVDTIGRYFDAELRASSETVASALELRFEAAPGTVVVDVSGYPLEQRGSHVTVRPGNLYAGQQRTLWVTLQVPTDSVGARALGQFSLQYKRDDQPYRVLADALPALHCTEDESAYERGIDRGLWEEAVSTHQFQTRQLAIGRAIGSGDAKDVDRELEHFEENRKLAEKLGSQRVLESIGALEGAADSAKREQAAPAPERSYRAKQVKARATFGMRSDAYNDDPTAGME